MLITSSFETNRQYSKKGLLLITHARILVSGYNVWVPNERSTIIEREA